MEESVYRYEEILRDILKKIEDGSYPPGTRLKSEKELSEQYKVSRITSKRALNILADRGYISRTPGRGSYVLERETVKEEQRDEEREKRIVSRRGKLIGVILDNFLAGFGVSLLKSIEQESKKIGYGLLLRCTYGNSEEEEKAITDLLNLGAEGLILMCVQNESYNEKILKLALEHFPLVLVDRKMKGISIPCVTTNNFEGAKALTRLLIERGHKKLCFLTHSSLGTSTIQERYDGFIHSVMEDSDVIGRVATVTGYQPTLQQCLKSESGYESPEFKKIVDDTEDCTGYLALESKLAAMLCSALDERNREKDVVCFDPMPAHPRLIAFIRQDEEKMGSVAVQRLHQIIGGREIREDIEIPFLLVKNDM